MRLDIIEFIRRFRLHVLPPAFQRIRHFAGWRTGTAKPSSPCAGS
jgi:hypothetical protein